MSAQDPVTKARMSTGLRIVFGVSLALNLLVVGAVAGVWLRISGGAAPGVAERVGLGRALLMELPREDRRALRKSLRQKMDRVSLRHVRINQELEALLRAEPFDTDAMVELMQQQTKALETGQMAMRESWINILSEMSHAERVAYADRLSEAFSRRRHRDASKHN